MNKLDRFILFIFGPFIYGAGFIKGFLGVYREHFFPKPKINFKPFYIETNQIFKPVETEEDFKHICQLFKSCYPHVDIFDLKISKYDYDPSVDGLKEKVALYSFGLRSEHIHAFDFTLRDYFNS